MKKNIQRLALVALLGSIAGLAGCNSNDNMKQRRTMKPYDQDQQRDRYMRDQDQMDDGMRGRKQDQSQSSSDRYRNY